MERLSWTERRFKLGIPAGWLPNVIERLRGTPCRLRDITARLNETLAGQRIDNKWSVKEHIGHLSDLEPLHEGRLDDILQMQKTLRPADMTNAKTNSASHNQKSLQLLLMDFSARRQVLVQRLETFDPALLGFCAMHPRLRTQMSVTDIAFFTAEHDDHHLASIRETIRHHGLF